MSTDPLEALRSAALKDPDMPESVRGFLSSGARLQHLSLNRMGQWRFEGAPVEHPRVVALFSRSLHQTSAGNWILRIPPFTYPVLVEGAGWFVRRLGLDEDGWFGTTTGTIRLPLDDAELLTDGDCFLGTQVAGRIYRFVESAYQDLLAEIDVNDAGRWSVATPSGRRFLALIDAQTSTALAPVD